MGVFKNIELRKYLDTNPTTKGWCTRRHSDQGKIWYIDHNCTDTDTYMTFVYYNDKDSVHDWKIVHERNIDLIDTVELIG